MPRNISKHHKGRVEKDNANLERNKKLADIFNKLKFEKQWSNIKLSEKSSLSTGTLTKLLASYTLNFQEKHLCALEEAFQVELDRETLEVQHVFRKMSCES